MKTTCKECRRFKRCMESSREYPCKDFAGRNEASNKNLEQPKGE